MVDNNRAWTQKETGRAIELFNDNYSASKIASIMNEEGWRKDCAKITRNAIVGILHRNGCSRDKKVKVVGIKDKDAKVKPVKDVKPATPKKKVKEIVAADEEPAEKLPPSSIVDLLPWECRFPVGELEADDFHFCGEQIDYNKNKSYCSKHYSLCYYPARRQLDEANNSRRP